MATASSHHTQVCLAKVERPDSLIYKANTLCPVFAFGQIKTLAKEKKVHREFSYAVKCSLEMIYLICPCFPLFLSDLPL